MAGSQTFEASEIEGIYEELGKLVVPLDDDPLIYGPKRLNTKVSQVRRSLDRTEKMFLDISHRLQMARRSTKIARLDFDLAKKNLFANDPETRAGRSVSDREAIAAGKLRKEVDLLNDLEILTGDLEAVLEVIKAKRADLKGTEARLKDQLQLCREELGLGHRWGSKVPDATVNLNDGRAAPANSAAFEELISTVDSEIHLAAAGGDWNGPKLEEEEEVPTVLLVETPEPPPAPVKVEAPAPVLKPVTYSEVVIDALPEVGDPAKIPAASAPGGAADDFLDSMPMTGMAAAPKGSQHVAMSSDSLLDFLADFESNG